MFKRLNVQVHKPDPCTTPSFFFTADGDYLIYEFKGQIDCVETRDAQVINVTFINTKEQEKKASVNVPVIYSK